MKTFGREGLTFAMTSVTRLISASRQAMNSSARAPLPKSCPKRRMLGSVLAKGRSRKST
jgi:hypothetical protein